MFDSIEFSAEVEPSNEFSLTARVDTSEWAREGTLLIVKKELAAYEGENELSTTGDWDDTVIEAGEELIMNTPFAEISDGLSTINAIGTVFHVYAMSRETEVTIIAEKGATAEVSLDGIHAKVEVEDLWDESSLGLKIVTSCDQPKPFGILANPEGASGDNYPTAQMVENESEVYLDVWGISAGKNVTVTLIEGSDLLSEPFKFQREVEITFA